MHCNHSVPSIPPGTPFALTTSRRPSPTSFFPILHSDPLELYFILHLPQNRHSLVNTPFSVQNEFNGCFSFPSSWGIPHGPCLCSCPRGPGSPSINTPSSPNKVVQHIPHRSFDRVLFAFTSASLSCTC